MEHWLEQWTYDSLFDVWPEKRREEMGGGVIEFSLLISGLHQLHMTACDRGSSSGQCFKVISTAAELWMTHDCTQCAALQHCSTQCRSRATSTVTLWLSKETKNWEGTLGKTVTASPYRDLRTKFCSAAVDMSAEPLFYYCSWDIWPVGCPPVAHAVS